MGRRVSVNSFLFFFLYCIFRAIWRGGMVSEMGVRGRRGREGEDGNLGGFFFSMAWV